MDDFLILTKTRWHLRKVVKKLNQFFNQFSFVQHPDKTFIGKIDKGFDWMGFQLTMQGIVDIAPRSMEKIIIKLAQLYEQNRPLLPIVRPLNHFLFNNPSNVRKQKANFQSINQDQIRAKIKP